MLVLLILAAALGGMAWLAARRLPRANRLAIAAIVFAVAGVLPIAGAIVFGDALGCWMYRDQCKAERIPGLSERECGERPDAVAYVHEGGLCLVRRD